MEKKEPIELMNLKPQDEFYLLGIRYKVFAKYDVPQILVRNETTKLIEEFSGDLRITPKTI